MLFNSVTFLVYFLPAALAGYFVLGLKRLNGLAIVWLTLTSLFFYGWWNIRYVPLLLGSIAVNFVIGRSLAHKPRKWLLVAGVALNLLLLGVCKYTGFLVAAANGLVGADWPVPEILLPLAISFFTFQQIAYLSDAYDGVAEEPSLANYCMFITFFPHLIAGPITHHREMLPQFRNPSIFRPRPMMLAAGCTVFLIGLFKKTFIADTLSIWVGPVFAAADAGHAMTALDAWLGAGCYMLQIYFDFSGYTDMAIGLGLMFGIRLPQNFDSPYKARNIIEFWSRWHMTLTRFLTAYIYNPISLNLNRARLRKGKPVLRRGRTSPGAFAGLVAMPMIVTMFLAGLWHGAGWQFIVFGLLHGFYLTVNHAWRTLKAYWGWQVDSANPLVHGASVLLTMLCVLIALVFFRAADVGSGLALLSDMLAAHGLFIPYYPYDDAQWAHQLATLSDTRALPSPVIDLVTHNEFRFALIALLIVWCLPNTQQFLRRYPTSLGQVRGPTWIETKLRAAAQVLTWRPTMMFGALVGTIGFFALTKTFSSAPTEFLYWKF
ncbi:MAG TPA: MBOAT family O-acyltransferase [Acetobacteraceae bacterium]